MPRAPKNIVPRITPAVVRAFYAKLSKKGEPDFYVLEKGQTAIHWCCLRVQRSRSQIQIGPRKGNFWHSIAVVSRDIGLGDLEALRDACRKKSRELEDEETEPSLKEGRRMTWAIAWQLFRDNYSERRLPSSSPRTLDFYDGLFQTHILPLFGEITLAEFASFPGSTCTLNVGTVVLGGSASRVFAVDVGLNLPAGVTQVTNTASFTTDANPTDNIATDTTPLAAGIPDLTLTKSASSTGATPGSTLTWTLAVANRGTAPAANVSINEILPTGTTFNAADSSAGWTCTGTSCTLTLGTVNAGASASRTFSARVISPANSSLTSISNTACVATTTAGEPTGNNCGSTSTPLGGDPRLQLAKTVSPGNGTPGSVILWRLTVTNTGDRDAQSVVLHETVPANTTFDAAGSSPAWSCNGSSAGSTCTANLTTVGGAGGSAALDFATRVVTPLPAGVTSVANTACATSPSVPDACGSTEQPTDGSAHLAIVKRLLGGNGAPGSILRYVLDVQNTGDQAASGVVLQETVPPNTTFLAAQSPGWTCTAPSSGSSCSLTIDSVAGGGASESRNFTVQVDNPLAAGVTSIGNTACIVGGPVGAFHRKGRHMSPKAAAGPDSCSTIVVSPAAAPVLTITKTRTGGPAVAGSTVLYTIAVSNAGNQDAAALSLVDTIPAGSHYAPPPASPAGWTCVSTTCTMNLGELAAGATATRTIAFLLDNPQPQGLPALVNQACVSDGSRNACASTSDPVAGSTTPALSLRKIYDGPTLLPGALLSFHLVVSNSGNADANGVRLRETVPTGAAFAPGSSDPAWTCSGPSPSCILPLAPLGPGQSRDVLFAIRAANPLPSGVTQIANVACLEDAAGSPIGCDQVSTPNPVQVIATLRDSLTKDLNHNAALNAGDVVRYTLVVRNPTAATATNLEIATSVDPHLSVIATSLTTTAGTIAAGAPPTVRLASLAPGASVTITFDATAAQLAGIHDVASQARVTGTNFAETPSDDPDTPEALDPTRTPVANDPVTPAPIPPSARLASPSSSHHSSAPPSSTCAAGTPPKPTHPGAHETRAPPGSHPRATRDLNS